MTKYIYLSLLLVLSACKHPESDSQTFSRDINQSERGLSQPANNNQIDDDNYAAANHKRPQAPVETAVAKNIIKMESKDGVKYIPVEINGIPLQFIFDTGASSISISSLEATLLYKQGTLKEEDFIGTQNFQDATGKISQGTKIRLKSVKIGDLLLENIEASIVDNPQAPLLLGQSVLEKFGSIEIDNINNQIILK